MGKSENSNLSWDTSSLCKAEVVLQSGQQSSVNSTWKDTMSSFTRIVLLMMMDTTKAELLNERSSSLTC